MSVGMTRLLVQHSAAVQAIKLCDLEHFEGQHQGQAHRVAQRRRHCYTFVRSYEVQCCKKNDKGEMSDGDVLSTVKMVMDSLG